MKKGAIILALVVATLLGFAWFYPGPSEESTCFGTTARGALSNAHRLPLEGDNYYAYSTLGWLLGRTFTHSRVLQIVLDAYGDLHSEYPEVTWVYGETGWPRGGAFKPHRTHQNGLSVDFMVPLRHSDGSSRELPTSPSERFGYDLEFDHRGKAGELDIDFDLIVAHLRALARAARLRRATIARVIFAPELQRHLWRTRHGSKIRHLPFSKRQAWVRHDEHYHVDFAIGCRPLGH